MLSKKIFLILLLTFFSTIYSQEKSDSSSAEGKWNPENLFALNIRRSPTITINYGISSMGLKSFNSSFDDPNLIDVKLGYTTERPLLKKSNIINYTYNSIFLSKFSTSLGRTSSDSGIKSNMFRFGFNRSKGFGYSFGKSAIILFTSSSFDWSKVDFKDQLLDEKDKDKLNLYDESFRFGTSAEGGVKIKIIKQTALDVSYERSIIFQRHLFWKWAGSSVLELAANFSLDNFIQEILEAEPAIAPIVNFILKNGLAYGIYELRQKKMNWPFSSEPPLSYDQVKFGLTFVF